MWKRLRTWWTVESEVHRLSGLDDRLLADMGVERGELRARIRAAGHAEPKGRADHAGPTRPSRDGGAAVPAFRPAAERL